MTGAEFSAPKMGGVFLSDNELAQLQELMWAGYPMAYVLYVQELRRYMDMATGVVGERRRICEQGLIETLEREAKRGQHGSPKKRSRQFVQRQISALEKYGLIERMPKVSRFDSMRFYLPMACEGLNRQQEKRTVKRAVKRAVENENNSVETKVYQFPQQKSEQQCELKSGHHHVFIQQQQGEGFSWEQLRAVDMAMVIQCYHDVLPGLPRLLTNVEGYRLLVARVWYAETAPEGKHQTERFWRGYFAACARSDFLMGRVEPNPRKGPFRANFKKLVEMSTVVKVINGEYT